MSPVSRQSQAFNVYTLFDPRSNEARYVGQTSESLDKRLMAHCKESHRKSTAKNQWIQELQAQE
ncbi:GIY-YIG nuclease family protein [Kocuria rhizophila]|uniref:GIY-YIG nuclease family protein n=1 Tax=Kocuria rhizophila TaxID=72000 RepID=UPI003879283F